MLEPTADRHKASRGRCATMSMSFLSKNSPPHGSVRVSTPRTGSVRVRNMGCQCSKTYSICGSVMVRSMGRCHTASFQFFSLTPERWPGGGMFGDYLWYVQGLMQCTHRQDILTLFTRGM